MDTAFHLTANELFDRIAELAARLPDDPGQPVEPKLNRRLHELLVLCCHEGVADSRQAFGNLFSQVDFLCRERHVPTPDRVAIQTMRRHSNHMTPLSSEDFRYDLRALSRFVSAVFGVAVPGSVASVLPAVARRHDRQPHADYLRVRCIVVGWDELFITATAEQSMPSATVRADYSAAHLRHLHGLLHEGMQLNLLDCAVAPDGTLLPALIIVEPDFLLDISSVAACFESYGHHPLNYTLRRLAPPANSQAILLGHLAGQLLDDTVNHHAGLSASLRKSFCRHALQYCTCPDFQPEAFKTMARQQAVYVAEAVAELFPDADGPTPTGAQPLLEPSFVCEALGLQGRVDLMTADFSLLVEQKSGKNMYVERQQPGPHGSLMPEPNYVQLLLYFGVLRHNFRVGYDQMAFRLLYSRYPARRGLVVVNFYRQLFREAIQLRNLIVAWDLHVARHGFESIIDLLRPEILNTEGKDDRFFHTWQLPRLQALCSPLQALSALERAYFCRMMTFVYREQRVSKLGLEEGVATVSSDPWNVPYGQKQETGDILSELFLEQLECSAADSGFDRVVLRRPGQGASAVEPNFRRGDAVFLYHYDGSSEPDLRRAILYKGVLDELDNRRLVVALNEGQHSGDVLPAGPYALEHAPVDTTTAAIRSLYAFAASAQSSRQLLLAQRTPRQDTTRKLSRGYDSGYDHLLLRALQARDYFLLVGPPGTGKTSRALRFLVAESLREGHVLLTAYTNRAVDEICDMLETAGQSYVRIGSEHHCDPRFRHRLLGGRQATPRLSDLQRQLRQAPVVVGTVLTLLAQPGLFQEKAFAVAIVDEASQILEPDLVGLLVRVPRFILIGDHKQLPAVVQQPMRDSHVDDPRLRAIGLTDCRNSLFQRLFDVERAACRSQFVGVLQRQGRMHPDIASFPCRAFYADARIRPVPLPHQQEPSSSARMVFIPVGDDEGSTPKTNMAEARVVVRQLEKVYREYGERFDPDRTVGVIVPYRAQIALIRSLVERLDIPVLRQVAIDTVERYQGSQRDVIVYSFTVSRPHQLQFLTATTFADHDGRPIDRKLNVALTRARMRMVLTGNPQLLSRIPLFAMLLDHIRQQGGWVAD